MTDEDKSGRAATEVASVDSAWIGREIEGRYRIIRLLGEGGMGSVFVAEHLRLQKEVALKVVRPEFAGNGEVAARFAREAMATAQFEHPNVVSAIDYGTLPEGGAYFVLQLVTGESLRSLLDREPALAWPRACELAAQVADALSAARATGIVHRDLKPDNILIQPREGGGELAKILDFGIAHIRSNDANNSTQLAGTQLTRVGTIVGTPGYMSPEQAVGESIDHRTDIYALGVVLWECIVGAPLWDAPDVPTLLGRQLSESPTLMAVASKRTDIPRELETLVSKMLARTPADRPQHAGEVRDSLRQLVAQQGSLGSNPLAQRWRTLRPGQKQAVIAIGAAVSVILAALTLVPLAAKTTKAGLGADVSAEKEAPNQELLDQHQATITQVMEGRSRKTRRDAARLLMAITDFDDLPEHIQLVARFEAAESCPERNAAIAVLEESGDKGVLPALERIIDAPKTGCGFLSLADCYSCIRVATRKAIDTLRE